MKNKYYLYLQKRREVETNSIPLMDTPICLVLRYISLDPFRVFEGPHAQCVLIAKPLPHRRFYDGIPVVELTDWRELGEIVDDFSNTPEALQKHHRASLPWWKNAYTEETMGKSMVNALASLVPPSTSSQSETSSMHVSTDTESGDSVHHLVSFSIAS